MLISDMTSSRNNWPKAVGPWRNSSPVPNLERFSKHSFRLSLISIPHFGKESAGPRGFGMMGLVLRGELSDSRLFRSRLVDRPADSDSAKNHVAEWKKPMSRDRMVRDSGHSAASNTQTSSLSLRA